MASRYTAQELTRRDLLKVGLVAGATWSAWSLYTPPALCGEELGTPKRGGILRARGWDPVHFDPHLTRNFKTHTALSFVYSKLLRHQVGADVPAGQVCVRASNGTTNRLSTGASWWLRM